MSQDHDDRGHQRLGALLALLSEPEHEAPPDLEARVMRTARWQYATRGALRAATEVSAVVGHSLVWMVSRSSSDRDRG